MTTSDPFLGSGRGQIYHFSLRGHDPKCSLKPPVGHCFFFIEIKLPRGAKVSLWGLKTKSKGPPLCRGALCTGLGTRDFLYVKRVSMRVASLQLYDTSSTMALPLFRGLNAWASQTKGPLCREAHPPIRGLLSLQRTLSKGGSSTRTPVCAELICIDFSLQ